MHGLSGGPVAAVGLVGSDGPPLSTETIGRSPSGYEAAPVALKSFEAILAEKQAAQATTATVTEIEPADAGVVLDLAVPETHVDEAPAATEARRVVVRLLGGEELELGGYDVREDAVVAARALVAQFSTAEAAGEWPEVEGRFVRPGAVASIDVQLRD